MGRSYKHTIVIGGSLAGLCAARILSDASNRVTVYERDELPHGPVNRATVPQDRHVHMLMARGAMEFESHFPGLLADMVAHGVPVLDNDSESVYFAAAGHVLGMSSQLANEFTAYLPSRPHLEWQIRRRVLAIDNVDLVHASVSEAIFDAARGRVTGVRLDSGDEVLGDLVVDATGRGTRLPVWLNQWGYQRPREDVVYLGIGYASQRVRIPDRLLTEKMVVTGVSRQQRHGIGMLLYEDGVWNVTAFGVGKLPPPRDYDEICDLADKILPARVSSALRAGAPCGEVAFHKFPTSRWRRYDKLDTLPQGILPFGDAVASFNPTFGQGMTMTSLQTGHLERALATPAADVVRECVHATAKTTFPVWTMNAIGDLVLHGATGPSPWWYNAVGGLFDQFLGAAESDPVLAEWILRRVSLLDSLYMVPSARLVARAVRHNMQLWLAGRRSSRPPAAAAERV